MKLNKTKLLILSDWYLPAVNAGGPVRSVSAIVTALKLDFEISLLTRDRDFGSTEAFPHIEADIWIKKDGFRLQYISPSKINEIVKREIQLDYDKIYMNSLFSFPFTINPLRNLSKDDKRQKVILAPRGMLGKGALELKSIKKNIFLFLTKTLGLYQNITWHASTVLEKKEIQEVFGNNVNVFSIENMAACTLEPFKPLEKMENDLKLIFVSRLSPKKNLKFLLELVSQLNFKVSLDIYGPIEDKYYWSSCKAILGNSNQKIEYKGILDPDDLVSVISNYHLFVFPTLNENFGHIILETLNSSVPIILSNQTPWLNLENCYAGKELSLRSKEEWVNWLNKFYQMGKSEYQKWREGAWVLSKNKLEQNDLVNQYINMFSE
jgi:glycosyltransferase involved in cell wall biosynthesis